MTATPIPDFNTLRTEAMLAGALDPFSIRFQIVEYDKSSGRMLGIRCGDVGFQEGIEKAADLIEGRQESHFRMEPVGYLQ